MKIQLIPFILPRNSLILEPQQCLSCRATSEQQEPRLLSSRCVGRISKNGQNQLYPLMDSSLAYRV